MSQQAERRVGTVIGAKWRVDALLGSGSMAAVYAVTHRNGARSALKILHPTLCTDPAVCERFLGEGYLTNSVKHSGIVRVLDDGVTDDGCVFLVMDLLEGQTLEALRQERGGKLSLVETLDIADKLIDILHAVHTAGIIHRDLKPQNVFIANDGTVKLLDFGVARVFDRSSQSKLSMFGLVLGTPSFMSPEQALGSRDKVDHRADIWSLGATMFTALTGETVHLGANVQARLLAAATVKARSIAMVKPDLPRPISSAIDMALRFKKEERWQTADAFRRALKDARVSLGLGRPMTIPPPDDEPMPASATIVDKMPAELEGVSPGSYRLVEAAEPAAEENATGAHGTFIGIGNADGSMSSVVGNDGSVPPAGLRMASGAPAVSVTPSARPHVDALPIPPQLASPARPPPVPSRTPHAPQVSRTPQASFRPPMPSAPPTDFGVPEGSIPAYGTSLRASLEDSISDIDPAALGVRRKGTVGVWLAAVVLAAIAASGVAFFAVKRGPLESDVPTIPSAQGAPPPSSRLTSGNDLPTSLPGTAGTPVTPSVSATVPSSPSNVAGAVDAGKPAVTPTPHPVWNGHAARTATPPPTSATTTTRPPVTAEPQPSPVPSTAPSAPTATPEPKPAPTPADPFGTPE